MHAWKVEGCVTNSTRVLCCFFVVRDVRILFEKSIFTGSKIYRRWQMSEGFFWIFDRSVREFWSYFCCNFIQLYWKINNLRFFIIMIIVSVSTQFFDSIRTYFMKLNWILLHDVFCLLHNSGASIDNSIYLFRSFFFPLDSRRSTSTIGNSNIYCLMINL